MLLPKPEACWCIHCALLSTKGFLVERHCTEHVSMTPSQAGKSQLRKPSVCGNSSGQGFRRALISNQQVAGFALVEGPTACPAHVEDLVINLNARPTSGRKAWCVLEKGHIKTQ